MQLSLRMPALIGAALLAMSTAAFASPFELTFNANGQGSLDACIAPCSIAVGPDNGIFTTNIGGLGGAGFDFHLPGQVGPGFVDIYNSSAQYVAALDFTSFDMYFVFSNLSNYTTTLAVTAAANGSFTFLGPYPTTNQYNGNLVPTVPEPFTLSLFAAGIVGAGALRRRNKKSEEA